MKGNFCRPSERHGPSGTQWASVLLQGRCRETGPGTGRGSQVLSSSFPSRFPGPSRLFSLLQMTISEPAALASFSRSVADPPFHPPAATLKDTQGYQQTLLTHSQAHGLYLPLTSKLNLFHLNVCLLVQSYGSRVTLTSPPPGRLSLLFHCACPRSSLLFTSSLDLSPG